VTSIATQLTTLQTLLDQIVVTATVNGTVVTQTHPGVAVALTVPGYGLVYRTVPDPLFYLNDVAWDYAQWDDAGYWSHSQPGWVFPPVTGRYAVGLNCPTCCLLDGTTEVEGDVTVVYSTTTEPETSCPLVLAVQPIRATNPTDSVPAVNIYAEFEVTGGTGEFFAVESNLYYQPSEPTMPVGGNDQCTFTVRYLGPARGTPTVPLRCVKRMRQPRKHAPSGRKPNK
jgi:hypothetical protein